MAWLSSEKQLGALMRQSVFACVETRRYNERLVCWCSAEPVRFLSDADGAAGLFLVISPISSTGCRCCKVPIKTSTHSESVCAPERLSSVQGTGAAGRSSGSAWRHAAHRDLLLEHRTGSSTELLSARSWQPPTAPLRYLWLAPVFTCRNSVCRGAGCRNAKAIPRLRHAGTVAAKQPHAGLSPAAGWATLRHRPSWWSAIAGLGRTFAAGNRRNFKAQPWQ